MRPRHTPHILSSFPIYSCAFLSGNRFVLGGGGGASRTGIKNKLRLYVVNEDRSIELKDEFELENGEDAPMSMAAHAEGKSIICGVNSVQEKMEKGQNENCRVFSIADDKIRLSCMKGTLSGGDADDYQKVTTLSPDGFFLAVAGSYDLTLLSFPSLNTIAEPIRTENEIYDISFSKDSLVLATTHALFVYSLPEHRTSTETAVKVSTSPKKSKKNRKAKANANGFNAILKLQQKVDFPASIGGGGTFRAVRYHPLDESILYTAVNASVTRSKTSKGQGPGRQGYVLKWNTKTWTIEKSRKVGDRSLTSFDISPDGRFVAYGSSDLSIGMLDTRLLGPCASILKAFEFPPTFVKFNPTTTQLIAGSADNSIRIVSIPSESGSSFLFFSILFALLIVLLAIAVKFYGLKVPSW